MNRSRGRSPRGGPRRHPDALRQVTVALSDRKAVDPVVLDLRGLSEATDYFVIASGTSDACSASYRSDVIASFSPEQASGQPVSELSDLYSLGVVVYELLSGEPPYQGESFLAVLDASIVTVALPDMSGSLGASTTEAPWLRRPSA